MLGRASSSPERSAPNATSWTMPGRSTDPDAPTFETIAKTPGLTSTALNSLLHTSHPTMPNIVIKGAAAKDIVAYILSLKEGD